MQTLFYYMILAICLNGAIAIVGEAMGYPLDVPINLVQFIDEQDALARDSADPNSFDPSQIFGQFLKMAQVIINSISFQYFISVLSILPLPDDFILVMQALGACVALFTVIYMMSGRATSLGP